MLKASGTKIADPEGSNKTLEAGDSAAGYDTRYLTLTYLAALILVGLLVITFYALLQLTIYRQVSDAPVINLSGRQRMLSQKITKETLLLATSKTEEMREKYHDLLRSSLDSWSRVHTGLQHGDEELRLPGNNSEEVQHLFVEMESYYKSIKKAADKILALKPSELSEINIDTPIVRDVVEASPLYLEWMDRTVFQYDKEAGLRVDSLKRYETYILFILLTLLALEAVFIFQPMVNRVRKTYRGFQQANKNLKQEITEHIETVEKLKTSRKEAERYAQQAEAANKAKSLFLANMSHELRTPMHAILNFSQMGVEKVDTASRDDRLRYFSRILESGQRLLGLLDDLLVLSRLEAGHIEFEMKENNLGKAVKAVALELDSVIKEHSLTLKVVEPEEPAVAWYDSDMIKQVLRNLFANAIKFTPDGKSITVSFDNDSLPPGNGNAGPRSVPAVAMTVKDEGIGIPDNELESIFEKFVESSSTRTGAGGTGLGLAICKEIVTAHKGSIKAEKNPEGGSIFKIILPKEAQRIDEGK